MMMKSRHSMNNEQEHIPRTRTNKSFGINSNFVSLVPKQAETTETEVDQ